MTALHKMIFLLETELLCDGGDCRVEKLFAVDANGHQLVARAPAAIASVKSSSRARRLASGSMVRRARRLET
jgi:hypothetical protein